MPCTLHCTCLFELQMARLPPLPDELRDHICSYLPDAVDLVRLSMVSKEWRGSARGHETKDRRPIFTDQAGVEEVWPHLPFGKVYGGHGRAVDCVRVDGGYLYTACRDGMARKIDVETGQVVWKHTHDGYVCSVHMEGGYLYTSCGHQVRYYMVGCSMGCIVYRVGVWWCSRGRFIDCRWCWWR